MATIIAFSEKCIIIKIKNQHPSIYERVRRCWNNNIERAKQADYVLAVIDGIVVGVFKPTEWNYTCDDAKCIKNNCEKYQCKRIGFTGEVIKKHLSK